MTEIERILEIIYKHSKVISEDEVHITTTQWVLADAIEQYVIKARIKELKKFQDSWEHWTKSPEYVLYQMMDKRIAELKKELQRGKE